MSLKNQAFLLAGVIIVIDQIVKVWVKTHMILGEGISVFGDWFYIQFVENPGMAFGMLFGGSTGKLILTFLRIAMAAWLVWFIPRLVHRGAPKGLVLAVGAILAGAVGNIIDCVFYGVLFSSSVGTVAQMFPEVGYAPLFLGEVVDMFYFPIIDTTLPNWIPIFGGKHFEFFRYIFNVADAAVSVSAFYLLIFQQKSLHFILGKSKNE